MAVTQLSDLVRPFPARFVHENPSGQGRGQYVAHDVVVQRLLQIVGPYDFRVVEVLRGDTKDNLINVVVGAVCELGVTIDGRHVTVQDVGDCERPGNWPHDGARMKDAISDAIKRCAMRLGCGLHLWAQADFYLHEALVRAESETGTPPAPGNAPAVGEAEGTASVPASPLSPKEKLDARARKLAAS